MASKSQEIVRQFVRESGCRLTGKTLEYSLRIAEAILRMEEDRKRASMNVRHLLAYVESAEASVSHGTIYNDMVLKRMVDWACQRFGEGGEAQAGESASPTVEKKLKAAEKKLKVLAEKALQVDSFMNDYEELRARNARNEILLHRAEELLRSVDMIGMLDITVTNQEVAQKINMDSEYITDTDTGEILERRVISNRIVN